MGHDEVRGRYHKATGNSRRMTAVFCASRRISSTIKGGIARLRLIITVIRSENDFGFILSLYFFYAIIYIIYMRRDGYNSGCDGYNFGEYMVIILGTLL